MHHAFLAVWHRRWYEVRIIGNLSQNTSCRMWNASRIMHLAKCAMNGTRNVMQHASRNRHYTKSITPRAPRSMDARLGALFGIVLLGSIPSRALAWSKITWLSCSLLNKCEVGRMISQSNTTQFQDIILTLTFRTPSLEPDFQKNGVLENITFKKPIGHIPGITFTTEKSNRDDRGCTRLADPKISRK